VMLLFPELPDGFTELLKLAVLLEEFAVLLLLSGAATVLNGFRALLLLLLLNGLATVLNGFRALLLLLLLNGLATVLSGFTGLLEELAVLWRLRALWTLKGLAVVN
jgi:hypothetical protein